MIIPKLDLGKCLGTQHLFLVFTEFVFIYAENSPSFQANFTPRTCAIHIHWDLWGECISLTPILDKH